MREDGFLTTPLYSDVFDMVNREDFVPTRFKKSSDSDEPIPLSFGQTQSAPHMDAILVEQGRPTEDDDILEIGTGSGYLTVILSLLGRSVTSIEQLRNLSEWSSKNIKKYYRKNIELITGNINRVCFRRKFDLVISTASFPREPKFLMDMVKSEGTTVFPLGRYPPQRLIKIENGKRKEIGWVAFVNIAD